MPSSSAFSAPDGSSSWQATYQYMRGGPGMPGAVGRPEGAMMRPPPPSGSLSLTMALRRLTAEVGGAAGAFVEDCHHALGDGLDKLFGVHVEVALDVRLGGAVLAHVGRRAHGADRPQLRLV